jgi:hypothetical protein
MNYPLIGLVGLLLLIIAGVFYCVITLSSIKEDLYLEGLVDTCEIEKDFPDVEVGE